jgi:hypothetical protein
MISQKQIDSIGCYDKERIVKDYMRQYPYICKDLLIANMKTMTQKDRKQYIESLDLDVFTIKDEE